MPDDELKSKKIKDLDFGVEKSMRYHQRRRGHYEVCHKIIMFFTIICGSAAFANFAELSMYFGAAAAILPAIDLVCGLSIQAKNHEILFRRFSQLAISIRTTGSQTEELLAKWIRERINIETDEPPMYCALEADCDNEVRRALGKDKKLAHIGLYHWLTMNYLRHPWTVFKIIHQPKEAP